MKYARKGMREVYTGISLILESIKTDKKKGMVSLNLSWSVVDSLLPTEFPCEVLVRLNLRLRVLRGAGFCTRSWWFQRPVESW